MLRETNGNPLLHTNSEANGHDTSTSKLNARYESFEGLYPKLMHMCSSTEHSAYHQTFDSNTDKVIDETTASGPVDAQHKLKSEEKITHDPSQIPSTSKAGASPPTEHKQHLHLPLRKRHLLASSTGSHHNENLGDSNHAIPTQTTGQAQDVETTAFTSSTNNTSTEPEPHQANMTIPKQIDPTPTEHAEPPDPPEPPETTKNIAKHILTEPSLPDSTLKVSTIHNSNTIAYTLRCTQYTK
jgi:hypothetical protein